MNIYILNNSAISYNIRRHENVLVCIHTIINNQNHTAMSKVSVFEDGWIDLVFEGRNKEYGAYQLRKQDPKTTMLALFTGIGIMVVLVSVPLIINKLKTPDIISPTDLELPTITAIEVERFELPKAPKPEPIVEEAAGGAAQSAVVTTAFTPLAPTSELVNTTVTNEILTNTQPSNITTEGTGTGPLMNNPGTVPGGTGNGPGVAESGPDTIEHFVDVAPLYPGGLDRFRADIADRFRAPDAGNLSVVKVLVSFVVEPDGTLSNIKATRDPGYGMGAEAIRVLKSLKAKWKPGMKGGKAVRTAYSLPITVKIN